MGWIIQVNQADGGARLWEVEQIRITGGLGKTLDRSSAQQQMRQDRKAFRQEYLWQLFLPFIDPA